MPSFHICILHGSYHDVKIDEPIVTLESLRREIESHLPQLPKYREIKNYSCTISGKPPHKLNLNNEEEFSKHQTLITNGC
ncbi:unnamed protein product, partial [Adineta steineri]